MTVDRQFDVRVRFEADCEAVAYHIQPTGTPAWLTEYFMHWAHPLGTEWSVAQLQPTRAELKAELTRIYKAANALGEALDDPITRAFLELQHNFIFQEKFADLGGLLRTMRNYAYQSAMSPALSDSTGKTKRGRGNAPVPEADNPKVFCALVVAEAWKFVCMVRARNSGRRGKQNGDARPNAGKSPSPVTLHHLEYVPVTDLVPDPDNPRLHKRAQRRAIARSIRRFGFNNPILIDKNRKIIAGHGRYEAASLSKRQRVDLALANLK
jgi:ParB-like nuclease domain